jgi:O-antigen/teichoic acid export membrane protein|uniref:O-antigen flippase Wzx n=1 Tax=Colwellia sp. C1 TaxID=1737566 RepID=A0A0P0LXU6_9GAMM|nr:O-antigen flippase Wzx [Colwellia sp. C1]
MKEKLLKSSIFRVIEIVTVTLISLALTPYLIKHLGDENYGLWLLILSTLGWFNFIDLGFASAVKREIAIALEKRDNQRINIVFSVAVVLFGTLGVVAASCILILALVPELLGITIESQETAAIALSILAIKVLLDFIMNSFHGFFTAYLRMDIDANISLLNTMIKSALVFYLIVDLNIYGAVIATIAADIVAHCLKVYYAKKLNNGFKFSLKFVSFNEIKHLFSYSKHLVAAGIANTILKRSDPVVISHIMGLKFVALYGVINNLINQIESLVIAIVGVFNPMLNRLVARNGAIDDVFKHIVDVNFFVVILLYTPLAILAEDFIFLWIGSEYAQYASLASILGFAYICKSISRPIGAVLLAQANHKLMSLVSLFGALLNISLSIIFAHQWGLFGVAIATAISFFISEVVLNLWLLRRYNDFSIIRPGLKFIVLALTYISIVLIGKLTFELLDPLTWFELIFSAGIIVITLLIFSWYLILAVNMRQQLITMLLKKEQPIQ